MSAGGCLNSPNTPHNPLPQAPSPEAGWSGTWAPLDPHSVGTDPRDARSIRQLMCPGKRMDFSQVWLAAGMCIYQHWYKGKEGSVWGWGGEGSRPVLMNIYSVSFLLHLGGSRACQGFQSLCFSRFRSVSTCVPYYRISSPCLKHHLSYSFVALKHLELHLRAF